MPEPTTIAVLLDRALAAYDDLAALGEDVEDEWTYVTDLAAAWRAELEAAAASGTAAPAPDVTVSAVERAIDEIARIEDPHRAIDWLSTFPQVVLLAVAVTA